MKSGTHDPPHTFWILYPHSYREAELSSKLELQLLQ